MTPVVVLVGLPGAGKSTIGRRLAKILAADFADSDDLVSAADGREVPRIFAESGEAAFRALETAAIGEALRGFGGVLALGGGALTHPDTRAALADSAVPVVLLHARLETLCGRVGDARSRPLLSGGNLGDGPAVRLRALAQTREPQYRELATLSVDTDGRQPGQVAATVAARLHTLARERARAGATQ